MNKSTDHTIGDLRKQKRAILFQVGKLVLQNPKTVLQEEVKKELNRAVICWSARLQPVGHAAEEKEMLTKNLKNMRHSLIRREAGKMSGWIEKSGIRSGWPELPEYRIRRYAIRALCIAFRTARSIPDFHRRAPFFVRQLLAKLSCNSPHCWSFRINPFTHKGTCTRGSGRGFL